MIRATLNNDSILALGDAKDAMALRNISGAARRGKMPPNAWLLPLTLEACARLRDMNAAMDAALLDAAERMRKVQAWVEGIKNAESVAPLHPPPIKAPYTLYAHQVKAFNLGLVLQNFAALMDMGTGKSITTVAITGRRFLAGKIRRVLIVAPTSVCAVWPREYEQFAAFPTRVTMLLGERDKRLQALRYLMAPVMPGRPEPLRVAVINYESTWRLEEELARFDADMIVCDESQRIKSPTAKQSKAMHRLGESARYRMILTGTPIQKDTRDIWSQFRFLHPALFGSNFYGFQNRYAIMGGVGNHQYLGPRNLDELTRKTHSIAFRVTKEECLDLPEQTFEDLPVELDDKTQRIYRQIQKESVAMFEGGEVTANNVLVRLLRLQQITGGFLPTDDGPLKQINTAKLDALADVVESYCVDEGKKLVIFSRFTAELDAIKERVDQVLAQERGLSQVMVRGDVPTQQRGDIVKRFQEDPACRVFVGQIDACAEGITLTAASTILYYSLNWNLAKYQQSLARIHRIGQRNACTYIHLVVPGTIDTKIMAALKAKEDLAKAVVDNWQSYFAD